MSRHRLEPPPRVRPRYGRMAAAATAFTVTAIALLGGFGVLPVGSGETAAAAMTADIESAVTATATAAADAATPASATTTAPVTTTPAAEPSSSASGAGAANSTALPADSGHGRRIVFDMGRQRVWLVDADGAVERSYLVSGSLTDNLHAGTYHVYSRSRWAVGIDDSGTMQYFVRFTHGKNAAIGFHSIPTKNGKLEQTRADLGKPQSHGCIRQWLPDAIKLWDFAPLGTKVVVTA